MKLKIFGKDLFEFSKNGGGLPTAMYNDAIDRIEKSKYIVDFYKDTRFNGSGLIAEWVPSGMAVQAESTLNSKKKKKKDEKPKEEKPKEEITPKGVYQLNLLNDDTFELKTDPTYVDEQIQQFKDKLSMIKRHEYDMNNGTVEIASILSRFENRKKYPKFKEFYSEFPYTTTAKILDLEKNEKHLKLGEVAQFLADMPQDAVDVMKKYTKQTVEMCGKEPVYYIIAKKTDFEKSQKRRDPILLAQSPFGHFWQILGAWDEEMLLLEDL